MSKPRINVVWFKCTDLRTHDHAALKAAHADDLPVLHLYVLDPFWYEGKTRVCSFPKTGVVRTRFQLEALKDLSSRLESTGHRLNVCKNVSTAECFRELCSDYDINAVFAFHEVCSEELRIQRQVQDVLSQTGQGTLRLYWGYELLHYDDLPFDPRKDRGAVKEIEVFLGRVTGVVPRPSAQHQPCFVSGPDKAVRWQRACEEIPGVAEVMGDNYVAAEDPGEEKDPRAELRWQGGETAALARVRAYLWDEDALAVDYVGATVVRNLYRSPMEDKATSKLSPWLAHGCLSPRLLYEEVERYMSEYKKRNPTARETKTYEYAHRIIRELMWRDFTRFGSIEAGTSIFKIGGRDKVVRWKQEVRKSTHRDPPAWPWSSDRELLQAWIDGRTGFPFIDSSMRELKVTGYCKHIGRLCVGWFLICDLGLDWRMGGEWFESVLVDYEPALNWFNWVYACLEPVDRNKVPGGKQQCLEILEAGIQHDPDAMYVKRWIPELSSLPTVIAREPWRLNPQEIEWAPKTTCLRKMQFSRPSPLTRKDEAIRRAAGPVEPTSGGSHSFGGLQFWDRLVSNCLPHWRDLVSVCLPLTHGLSSPPSFRYGVDYPKPVIQPVSLMHAESTEARVRFARERAEVERARELAGWNRSHRTSAG
eukprot:gnl/TRDRNA2_/TRDRNA2_35522_c0_seq1.p1 gnl/TRDRNA2_/TRDRNA2_35522_c0~~gnl/TRDRNA2_/TRDRNA2_35522_c0_seq1.p1  ORF type:complete len:647 (+),score=62.58 gnl/TRDRNA2_/TRDRNA2_35522_c0_seq1:61-2001(+)